MHFDILIFNFSVLPKLFAKKFLGIDVGTSSIRIVELEAAGQKFSLSNYGQIDVGLVESDAFDQAKNAAAFSADETVQMIQTVLAEAKIKTRQCAFSIPDFSTFFTAFSLPPMTEKELPAAVMFEARQHIPLPMESVTVDWQLVGGEFGKSEKLEVTVAAIPNEVIALYQEIAAKAKLQIILLEAEIFGLCQALVAKDEARAICLVDIGAQSTVCSLIEKQVLRYSHSFDRGRNYLVEEIIKRLPINPETARDIRSRGLNLFFMIDPETKRKAKDLLRESLIPVFKEIEVMMGDYRRLTGSEAAKIIVSGGTGAILETKELFADYFKKEIEIADPFKDIYCRAGLESELKNIGPAYAVAVGMAQRGFKFSKRNKNKPMKN